MDLSDLSDRERLVLGLRFRLKHIRLAMADVQAGGVPDGFEFSPAESVHSMLAELKTLEADVLRMLRDHGADEDLSLN